MTYKEWPVSCSQCPDLRSVWGWSNELPLLCPHCNSATTIVEHQHEAPMIAMDSIPGGIMIRHGICNPDGTPKRYDSMSDIKRACNKAGVTIHGDTPKPYRV